MTDFKTLFADIQDQVQTMATQATGKYKDDAISEGKRLLKEIKEDLERWVLLLAEGHLKPEEFTWLVNSNKSLVKMTALKKAGMAVVEVKKFSVNLLNIIVEESLKAITAKK